MAADSGCVWNIITTTWSDGSQTVETQLACKGGGGGGSGLDPYATNFGGGAWSMPSSSIYDGLVNEPIARGGGRQVASNSDDTVQEIINSVPKTKENCTELTAAEVAADQSGKEFPVLRGMSCGERNVPEGWVRATPEDIEDYKAAVGKIPGTGMRCGGQIYAMSNPARDAKLPGECAK